jgi:hypothetical protein
MWRTEQTKTANSVIFTFRNWHGVQVMSSYAQIDGQDVEPAFVPEALDSQHPDVLEAMTDAPRSVGNIAAWRSYLPQACVDAMIAMGWDHST